MTPTWHSVDWSQTMAGNDEEGDCGEVCLANLVNVLIQPQIVGRTEVERFYTIETGWTAENPASDKGSILEVLIKDWIANGWPSDPTIRPTGYKLFRPKDIRAALAEYVACPCAITLTEDQDCTDAAIGKPAAFGHGVLVVDATPETVTLITWARAVTVSMAWWLAFAKDVYGVELARET